MGHMAFRTDSRAATGDAVRVGLLRNALSEDLDGDTLQFETIDRAYTRFGGLVPGDAMAMAMRKFWDQPISTLARWIVNRTVISLDWHGQTLLPLFQFDPIKMSPRSDVRDVAQTLAATYSNWDVALWFAQPNARLGDEVPIDVIERDLAAVVRAAQSAAILAIGQVPAHA